jgi:hypothetical protein
LIEDDFTAIADCGLRIERVALRAEGAKELAAWVARASRRDP